MRFRFGFGHRNGNRPVCKTEYPCTCEKEAQTGVMSLAEATPGSAVSICCLRGCGPIVRRLAEMGFTPGTNVRVLRRAPFSDPIEFDIRGYLVSLRREEAALVTVQIVTPHSK